MTAVPEEMEVKLTGSQDLAFRKIQVTACLFQAELQTTISIWNGNFRFQIFSTRDPAGQALGEGILGSWQKWKNKYTKFGKETTAPQ